MRRSFCPLIPPHQLIHDTAAVATDDVETLSDLLFDDVDDQERLRKLNGAEAASARLIDRLGVFAEIAAIVGTAPLVLKGLAKGGSEITGALGVALAPVVANRFGKSKFSFLEKYFLLIPRVCVTTDTLTSS